VEHGGDAAPAVQIAFRQVRWRGTRVVIPGEFFERSRRPEGGVAENLRPRLGSECSTVFLGRRYCGSAYRSITPGSAAESLDGDLVAEEREVKSGADRGAAPTMPIFLPVRPSSAAQAV